MKHLLAVCAFIFAVSITHAQFAAPVPAYNTKPPAKGEKVLPVLTQQQLAEMGETAPAQKESYKAAAKVPALMTQMPCYCYCDRNHGHKNLHSCFEGSHGAECSTCMAESLYTYKMSKKGWTADKIRDGIIRGDWKQIDLAHPEPVN
jgi:Protein of unknown function with PCYCGC motif